MDGPVESDKWLWQPHRSGPIYLRVGYCDRHGKRQAFIRSLRTNHRPTARKIRDAEFTPIILDIEKARAQLELIEELYPQLLARLETGVHGGYAADAAPAVTLGEVAKAWYKALSASGGNYATATRTAIRYQAISARFVATIGPERPCATITDKDVAAYRDARLTDDRVAKKTIELELLALRRLFAFAKDKHDLATNPAKGVTVNRTTAERRREARAAVRRPPTRAEADRICLQFPSHRRFAPADFQDYAMVARYTGLRQGEIAHLRTADLRLYAGELFVDQILKHSEPHQQQFQGVVPAGLVLCVFVGDSAEHGTKTGLERLVPVADKLLPVIERRLKSATGAALFPFAEDDDGANFGRLWLKKVKSIHTELTMHGFRHYAASEMENNGVNGAISRLILGHVDGSVHDDYFHKQVRSLKEAVDLIY